VTKEINIAERLFKGIEAKDIESVAALYADEVRIWHNFSNAEQTKSENLAVLESLAASVASIRYEVLERHLIGDRVWQRHNLICRTKTAEEFLIPACIFITIRGDKIVRIDEYLDSNQANALRIASGREPLNP
jgi:ketosteroid isomerase-like protein